MGCGRGSQRIPSTAKAAIAGDIPELDGLWTTGWRTARLCAHETYMDAPYWEQLQYVGDTRIQALISYVMTGDSRLARQAILNLDDSRVPEGITQSRYPSAVPQFIPPFSLLWVGMLHDYWMYVDDEPLVKETLPHTRTVLDWFAAQQRPDGLLGRMGWWEFGDWTADYPLRRAAAGSRWRIGVPDAAVHRGAARRRRNGIGVRKPGARAPIRGADSEGHGSPERAKLGRAVRPVCGHAGEEVLEYRGQHAGGIGWTLRRARSRRRFCAGCWHRQPDAQTTLEGRAVPAMSSADVLFPVLSEPRAGARGDGGFVSATVTDHGTTCCVWG